MKDKIIEELKNTHPKHRSRKISEDSAAFLTELYPSYPMADKIRFLFQGLESEPRCKQCDGVLKNSNKDTCSIACRTAYGKETGKVEQAQKKGRETLLQSYRQDPERKSNIQKKRLATNMKKYGSKVSPLTRKKAKERSSALIMKGRETLMTKYGVSNPGQLPNHTKKCAATTIKKYGVTHYTKSKEYREKASLNFILNYVQLSPDSIDILGSNLPDQWKQDRYARPNQVVSFRCTTCASIQQVPTETFRWRVKNCGTPCSHCAELGRGSLKEKEVSDFITSLGITVTRNDRTLLEGRELDILIPEKSVAVEFCGLFWHNDARLPPRYHVDKFLECREKGIHLITLFEDEWDYNKELVKDRIRYTLGAGNFEKLHGRECAVKVIDTVQAKQFINDNHLQGYAPSTVKLGLFHNGSLVSAMTFSKPNQAKGYKKEKDCWELSRFCTKKGVIIRGGASKLLDKFVTDTKPLQIITFADLRWSSGKVYESMGFRFAKNTRIGYWYIVGDKRVHRYSLRKNANDDQRLTEAENRRKQGYTRIWDCGHAKYTWAAHDL